MAKYRFQVLGGTHVEDGTSYDSEDSDNNVVETDKPLDKMFANKFKRLPPKAKASPAEVEEEEIDLTEQYGDEVTGNFQAAVDADLKVFKKGSKFTIVTDDGEVVNEKPIRFSKDVKKAVKKYVKDLEAEEEDMDDEPPPEEEEEAPVKKNTKKGLKKGSSLEKTKKSQKDRIIDKESNTDEPDKDVDDEAEKPRFGKDTED
jgi:hypothetical protein